MGVGVGAGVEIEVLDKVEMVMEVEVEVEVEVGAEMLTVVSVLLEEKTVVDTTSEEGDGVELVAELLGCTGLGTT